MLYFALFVLHKQHFGANFKVDKELKKPVNFDDGPVYIKTVKL